MPAQRKQMNDIRPTRRAPSRTKKPVSPVATFSDITEEHDESITSSAQSHVSHSNSKGSDFFEYVKSDKRRHVSRASTPRPISRARARKGMIASEKEVLMRDDGIVTQDMPADSHEIERTLPRVEWHRPGVSSRPKARGIWWVTAVATALFIIVLLNAFAGATVKITPKQERAFIEGTFSAFRGGGSDDEMAIAFEVMDVTGESSIEIPATEERNSERRASGTIVIYNNHSTSEQRLVKKTRFEDTEGHIYRVNESIIVPGMRTEDGKVVPGSIEVTVYADEPGENYNIGLADFTLPGFKGSPQYDKIYARSKTPMTGGFVGLEKVASLDAVAAAQQELEKKLSEKLLSDARSQTPDGSILAEYATIHTFERLDPVPSDNGKGMKVTVRGTLHVMVFEGKELARFIARRSIATYDDADVYFSDPSQLTIGIVPEGEEHLVIDDAVTVSLGGTPYIVWDVDKKEVLSAIIGRSKKEFDETMKKFSAIASAQASLHPFWKGEFPEDAKDISIVQIIDGKEVK